MSQSYSLDQCLLLEDNQAPARHPASRSHIDRLLCAEKGPRANSLLLEPFPFQFEGRLHRKLVAAPLQLEQAAATGGSESHREQHQCRRSSQLGRQCQCLLPSKSGRDRCSCCSRAAQTSGWRISGPKCSAQSLCPGSDRCGILNPAGTHPPRHYSARLQSQGRNQKASQLPPCGTDQVQPLPTRRKRAAEPQAGNLWVESTDRKRDYQQFRAHDLVHRRSALALQKPPGHRACQRRT